MIKFKQCIPVCLGIVILLSAAKNDNSEQLMKESLATVYDCELVNGYTLSPDSLKGKMVLLNFWASYDAESRINNYHLVDVSKEYKNAEFCKGEGLEVVSISLDRFKSPLKKAIRMDGTQDFYHICDFKGRNSEVVKYFGVDRPINILIDADGNIVSRDFDLETIEMTLALLSVNK